MHASSLLKSGGGAPRIQQRKKVKEVKAKGGTIKGREREREVSDGCGGEPDAKDGWPPATSCVIFPCAFVLPCLVSIAVVSIHVTTQEEGEEGEGEGEGEEEYI